MRPTKSSHCFEVKGQQVKFSSTFDSGNLRTVTQIAAYQFLVESSHDTYETPASNKSFFHFKIQNYPTNESIRIIIKNLSLLDCIKPQRRLYYKPCYSFNGQDYEQVPENSSKIIQQQYSINLQIRFEMIKPVVYFAFSLPYSYQRYLNMIRDLPDTSSQFYIKKEVLCYSKSLHLVYMITITSYDRRTNQQDQIGSLTNGVILPEKHLDQSRIYFDKPVILLSARVHPGQTPSSWAIQGIIKFLISNIQQAKILRKNFQIIIVPMLNPDGVYEGMYRLDTEGHNLNRYYLVSDNRQPSIYSMKHLIKHYNSSKRLLFYFDFHGHPSYKGSFLYGNAIDDITYQAQTQLFGRIMSLHCDTFQEKYCIFDRQQMSSKDKYDMYTKQGCARVYALKTANILHSYTVQMGFHGCTQFQQSSNKNIMSFSYKENDYYNQGVAVMKSVLEVCSLVKSNINKKDLRKQIALQILTRQERFRKQDKNVSKKKKNVNQIIQNQYWAPIRMKFFSHLVNINMPKIRKVSKNKIISRTSFISSSLIKNIQQVDQITTLQHKISKQVTAQKLNTQIFQAEENSISKNYLDNKRKKLQMRNMIFSNKKQVSCNSNKKQQNSSTKKMQPQKKISIQKNVDKPRRSEIKILSSRNKSNDSTNKVKLGQNFQQFIFNDLNLRKGTSQISNELKNNYCILSADKVSSRVDQLKQIFRSDALSQMKFRKTNKTYKKYSSFFS